MGNKEYRPITDCMPVKRKGQEVCVIEPLIGYELEGVPYLWNSTWLMDYEYLETLTDEEQQGLAIAWPTIFTIVEDEDAE